MSTLEEQPAHARNGLGPSGSSRWLQCTASVRLTKQYAPRTNAAAELGTAVHELGEICLLEGGKATDFLGKTLNHHKITQKMADDAQFYVDYVRSYITETSELFVEARLDLQMIAEGTFGSSDAIITSEPILHVFDYKNGRGHVSPIDNSQGKLYALGAYHEHSMFYDFETVMIHIVQPNSSQGGHASSWEISVDDLLAFEAYAHERAMMALSDDSPCEPSQSACQWCDHSAHCKAVYDYTMDIADTSFTNLDAVKQGTDEGVTLDMVADILAKQKLVTQAFKAYEARLLSELEAGEKVEGWKLVKKRANKKWVNETDAYKKLIRWFKQEEFTTRKIATPTQVSALIGKDASTRKLNAFKELWEIPEAGITLAPSTDKRPEYVPEDSFTNLEEEY